MERYSVMLVCSFAPWPVQSGVSACIYPRLRLLGERFDVHLVCGAPAADEDAIRKHLEQFCRTVSFVPLRFGNARWHQRAHFLRCTFATGIHPLRGFMGQRKDYQRACLAVAASYRIDLVQCENCYYMEALAGTQLASEVPIVIVEHNFEPEYIHDLFRSSSNPLVRTLVPNWMRWRMRRFCRAAYVLADEVCFISSRDAARWRSEEGNSRKITSRDVIVTDPGCWKKSSAASRKIALLGSATTSQVAQGILWFDRFVIPLLSSAAPLAIVAPASLERLLPSLPDVGIRFIALDERDTATMDAQLTECDVFAAPLFHGSGIKMKSIIALALGLPAVATTKSMEGIHAGEDEGVFITDEPTQFAGAIMRILADAVLRQLMSEGARRCYERYHSVAAASTAWVELVEAHIDATHR